MFSVTSISASSAGCGILRSSEFASAQWRFDVEALPLADLLRVHDWNYVRSVRQECSAIPDTPT